MPVTAPAAPLPSFEQTVAEVEARIGRAKVRIKPFPHIVVDDLLPPHVRRGVDGYWPDPERLRSSNHFQRAEIRTAALAEAAQGPERAFWLALRHLTVRAGVAARARLERHLADKFRPLVGPDWRRKVRDATYLDRDAMLAHYTGVVDLMPHVDHARVVVNGFVYLDDPDMPTPEPRRGTMLYRSIGFAWPSNVAIPAKLRDRLLKEAVDVSWRDNRLLAYINGPWSFHGVPRHDLGDSRRRLLMFGTLLDDGSTARLFDETIL